jgi:hypothetical protein
VKSSGIKRDLKRPRPSHRFVAAGANRDRQKWLVLGVGFVPFDPAR